MVSLTLEIEPDVLRLARSRASREGTSVNAFVREQVTTYALSDQPWDEARRRLLDLAKTASGSSGPTGRTWTRDSLHDR